ncbi:hypothetical protein E1176_01225 [Fulvivirga sp. RKSG066]|uniref:hypothetical protein n=1 Tax=Fulvivirga aurantia TaxID=2529383 RepID=UPI0012BD6943|nr:hypothetical protein [Fulvivirga aurantia]MTI19633.1 hypothetical protein [Fulvivirga aurantia]
MSRFSITAIICLIISLESLSQTFKPDYATALDAEAGTELLNQCSRSTPDNITDFWMVTDTEVVLLEQNFRKLTRLKSSGCCYSGVKIKSLRKFGYQYIGVTIKGKRYIYINAFHIDKNSFEQWYKNWETEPIVFCDGGDYFWGVLFDLKSEKFKDLNINGIA